MKEKLKLIKGYYLGLISRRFKYAKNQLKRLFAEGHIYPTSFYYDSSRKLGYIVITKVLSTSLQKMMLDLHNISYCNKNIHLVHHKNFYYNSPPHRIFFRSVL